MPDYIKGPVDEIIDSETIGVVVEYVGNANRDDYDDYVTIKIKKLDPPFLKKCPEDRKIKILNEKLLNQTVYCHFTGKRPDGSYTARVTCEGPDYRGKKKRV
jgi:hypothetical protein